MSVRSPASDLFPVAAVGVAILALGGLLLLIGAGTSVGDPSEFDTWLVGVGLVLLLGAMLVVLIRAGPPATNPNPPNPSSTPSASPAAPAPLPTRTVVETPSPGSSGPTPDAPEAAPAVGPPRVPVAFPGSVSIPAQYDAVRREPARSPGSEMAWDESATGVSSSFAAAPAQLGASSGPMNGPPAPPPFAPPGLLEREVERLRDRVHELERSGTRTSSAPAAAPNLGALSPRRDGVRPPEPPSPSAIGSRRLCTGCGAGLPGGTTDPLCWGCGRPLCSTCYWRAKEGAYAHTCPACFARAGTMAVSGGRGPPPAPTSPVANPRT
jgi:hypothetical protein